MKIRLTRKFADLINGIDLSNAHEGETLDLSPRDAQMLLAEGWAEFAGPEQPRTTAHEVPPKNRRTTRATKKR